MEIIARCPECNVPEPFNHGQVWLNNGDIVQWQNPETRVGFIECENLDPLFANIGEIIGMSIERIVVNLTAGATWLYMQRMIPQEIRDMVIARQLNPDTIGQSILTYCHIVGFGKYEQISYRYERDEEDYAIFHVAKPFSVPLAAGAIAGALSGIVGGMHGVAYEEVSPEIYEFTTSWTDYPQELLERFEYIPYKHRDGDIELERCATCGIPKAFSTYRWELDNGLILNERTGRRMALLGPESLDLLFEELEKELGETIPEVVVEAQRRFVKTGFYYVSELYDEGEFRTQLALKGLGNLREITMDPRGLTMRIDNAIGYLLTVGMVQGLFEMAFDVDSSVEWELSEYGNLEVEIVPKA